MADLNELMQLLQNVQEPGRNDTQEDQYGNLLWAIMHAQNQGAEEDDLNAMIASSAPAMSGYDVPKRGFGDDPYVAETRQRIFEMLGGK